MSCRKSGESTARDAGLQAVTVVPGFAAQHDGEGPGASHGRVLLPGVTGADDRWSRGAADVHAEVAQRRLDNLSVIVRPGGHSFPANDRQDVYALRATLL
ncbi:hypothetical protein FNH13_02745 [Ornithinimicrobium ciconiae]|uniref:Uncharacterized protein n=1 Tax=Ornithinimicrobium ciconiae TaxID=2594265 RepID=A0A516G778_9MICO|nr:hypothetical protein [Ornithinimicrobium ciconiae]QDO87384.1 hypothetical protein FNH13_02745 [Ornithinimicrobium ciconiae]